MLPLAVLLSCGVDLYGTGGYGENRDARRASVMLHYENHFGDSTYRVGATAYTASFHSAGVLREDDYAAHSAGGRLFRPR